MTYARPTVFKGADFHDKAHEELVESFLPEFTVSHTTSPDKLDWWVPGYFMDLKEKRQSLTPGWTNHTETPESDLIVIDELGYRKANEEKYCFLLFYDKPNDRHFLAPIWELACCERKRFNRDGKGKLVLDMTQFHPVTLEQLHLKAVELLSQQLWKQREPVGLVEIEQVKKLKRNESEKRNIN